VENVTRRKHEFCAAEESGALAQHPMPPMIGSDHFDAGGSEKP
jgi:hypothetical protein